MNDKQRKQLRFSVGYFLLALLALWLIQSFVVQPYLIDRSVDKGPTGLPINPNGHTEMRHP